MVSWLAWRFVLACLKCASSANTWTWCCCGSWSGPSNAPATGTGACHTDGHLATPHRLQSASDGNQCDRTQRVLLSSGKNMKENKSSTVQPTVKLTSCFSVISLSLLFQMVFIFKYILTIFNCASKLS